MYVGEEECLKLAGIIRCIKEAYENKLSTGGQLFI